MIYNSNDMVLVSEHAAMRFRQRDLKVKDIRAAVNDEGSMSRIITAYYPDPDKWSEDFKQEKSSNYEMLKL